MGVGRRIVSTCSCDCQALRAKKGLKAMGMAGRLGQGLTLKWASYKLPVRLLAYVRF